MGCGASFETAAPRPPQDEEGLRMPLTIHLILRSARRARLEGRTLFVQCTGGESPPPSHAHDLARVHDVVGVERLLDEAHDAERLAVLRLEEIDLAVADAVLAGAGAFERECAGDQTGVEPLGL